MVSRGPGVIVVVRARAAAVVRELGSALEPSLARATRIEPAVEPVAAIVARARGATPARGVVVVVSENDDADAPIAAGADEVVVEPVDRSALGRAIRRAALRAGVREGCAGEARLLGQVLDGLVHAVEGPLAAIALDVDAVRAAPLATAESAIAASETEAALDDCGAAVEHVARVVRDATLLATRPDREATAPVALGPLLAEVLRALGGSPALRAHIELRDGEAPAVLAPRRTLARALAQLVVQALDAVGREDAHADDAPALRRLRIGLRALEDAVAIVIDARPALDAAPASSRLSLDVEGRLAAVREVLRGHGGELVAERAVDGEVRFVVFVPRPIAAPESDRVPQRAVVSAHRLRPRVLVVDRDARFLRASVRALSERFDVLVAVSGEEALSIAREDALDAVIVDALLPDMTALAFVDDLRRIDEALATRVVYAAGAREPVPVPRGAPVVVKPVRRDALLAALDALLRDDRSRNPSPSRILN